MKSTASRNVLDNCSGKRDDYFPKGQTMREKPTKDAIEVTQKMRDVGAFELFMLLGAVENSHDYSDVAESVFRKMSAHCRPLDFASSSPTVQNAKN